MWLGITDHLDVIAVCVVIFIFIGWAGFRVKLHDLLQLLHRSYAGIQFG
jgi:hypothetical protein